MENAPRKRLQAPRDPRSLRCAVLPSSLRRRRPHPSRHELFLRRAVLTPDVVVRFVGDQDGLEEFDLLGFGRVDEVVELVEAFEGGDYFEGVALTAGTKGQ